MSIDPAKFLLIAIILAWGIAILISYAHGLITHPSSSTALWGGLPASYRPMYVISMLLATAGFFAFTLFILFKVDPQNVLIAGRFGFATFNILYLAILLPSALWMPLTFQMLREPSPSIWTAIRVVLTVVGVASLGMILTLALLEPRQPGWSYSLALVGSLVFAFQTAILDMLVWPAYFKA